MAALEVVKRRLVNVGLGDMCLELHSNKANKRAVLQDLRQTLELKKPQLEDVQKHCADLVRCRDQINQHLEAIHKPVHPSGVSAFQAIGQLVRLRAAGTRPPEFQLSEPLKWTRDDFESRLNVLRTFVERTDSVGRPSEHPWRGVDLDVVLPTDVDRILTKLPATITRLEKLQEAGAQIASSLDVEMPIGFDGIWEAGCREAKIDSRFRQITSALNNMPDVRGPLTQVRDNLKTAVEEHRVVRGSRRRRLESRRRPTWCVTKPE